MPLPTHPLSLHHIWTLHSNQIWSSHTHYLIFRCSQCIQKPLHPQDCYTCLQGTAHAKTQYMIITYVLTVSEQMVSSLSLGTPDLSLDTTEHTTTSLDMVVACTDSWMASHTPTGLNNQPPLTLLAHAMVLRHCGAYSHVFGQVVACMDYQTSPLASQMHTTMSESGQVTGWPLNGHFSLLWHTQPH